MSFHISETAKFLLLVGVGFFAVIGALFVWALCRIAAHADELSRAATDDWEDEQ